jgi:signal transduction histidine kinase
MQSQRERLSIRAAVVQGCGLILGLWLFAWMQLSLRIGEAQARAEGINTRYVKAQETLANIRARVLIASVAFRDALLDPNPENLGHYRNQLEQTYTALDELMRAYVPVSNSKAEREQFAQLRVEVDGYRSSMLDVLASDRNQWLAEARNVLSRRVTPRRDVIIRVSEGVQTVNRAGYVEQQSEIAGVYQTVQRDLWQLLGLALAIGIAVAVLAVVYAGRLEQQLRRQMARDEELAHDLQELSAKLVTAQEQERRHIARELHDEIGQALTAIKVELAYAGRSIDGGAESSQALHTAKAITDSALHQVRDLSYLLHPAALDEFGLVSAIESHIKSFGRRHEIAAELVHEGMDSRLAPETEAAAYRIVQEALNNVAKHARATECRVHLTRTPDMLRITIEDNGTGFDPSTGRSPDRRGLGIVGIRERAAHLKGSVVIDTAPGRGTRLVVELPVRRATDSGERLYVSDSAALANS